MGSPRMNHGLRNPWIGVYLSHSDNAFVRVDFDNDVILGRRTGGGVVVRNKKYM
jgi:hypothetical protein